MLLNLHSIVNFISSFEAIKNYRYELLCYFLYNIIYVCYVILFCHYKEINCNIIYFLTNNNSDFRSILFLLHNSFLK